MHVRNMCTVMQHGGPDDEGVYSNAISTCCLGNRRLSILDLSSAGHQPMATGDDRLVITYNGEIYNFIELREELIAAGQTFKTDSDTEVILRGYDEWGTDAFARLSGMFAFALYDASRQRTYLVRDPSGIKPLYYATKGDELIFASEVKAFALSGQTFFKDERWKLFMLAFGYIPEPNTTFKSVMCLPKGHFMLYDHSNGACVLRPYEIFQFSSGRNNYNDAVGLVREKLRHAVKSHLIADVPVGVFLSGGIDSSILTLLAHEFAGDNVNAISIDHQEETFTERPYRRLINNLIGKRNTEYLVTYDHFRDNFDRIIGAMDQPSTDGINSWFASMHAREHGLKCILSGLGADELFGGYPAFRRMALLQRLQFIPKKIMRQAERFRNVNYRRLYYLSYDNQIGQYLFLRGYYTPSVIARILQADVREIDNILSAITLPSWLQDLNTGNRASWNAMNVYMQNQLLKDTDYMSMSHGLEVRLPFLDRDLINLVLSIEPEIKFTSSLPKSLLIHAFKSELPEEIWKREKMGFTFPFQEWMKRFDRISDPNNYRNKEANALITQFRNGELHWSNAFALYHVSQS